MKSHITMAIATILTLSGCAAPKPINEQVADNAVQFKDVMLSGKYSDAMQRMYVYSRVKPHKEDNLDTFFIGKNYHAVSDASLATSAVAAVAGSINIFQLGTGALLNAANRTSLNSAYTKNRLFVIEPVLNGDVKTARTTAIQRSLNIISKAYKQENINTKAYGDSQITYARVDDTIIVPYNNDNSVPFCSIPDGYKSLIKTGDTSNHGNEMSCWTSTFGFNYLIKNNTTNDLFPKGDFIITFSNLPAVFPIQHLESNSQFDYVYQPSYTFFDGLGKKNIASLNADELKEFYADGAFVDNPKITLLKTGNTEYFKK